MSTFNKYRLKGAYHYDWYETEPWYKECVDTVVGFCEGDTIDVGCGDGLLAKKIAEKGWSCVGIDPDPHAIELAKKYGRPALFQKLALDDATYELFARLQTIEYLACLNVIEHLDRPQGLIEMIHRTISEGAIIMTLEWQGGAFGEDHKHEYTLDELTDFFKEFKPKPFRIKKFPEWIGVKIKL